jgi:hypothetical protein
MGRGYDIKATCQHPECPEWRNYHYDNRRDADKSAAHRAQWKCLRHTGFTLSIAEPVQTFRSVSGVGKETGGHLFWSGSGLVLGPGFKAFADDFPPGTVIEVTARIILPGSDS